MFFRMGAGRRNAAARSQLGEHLREEPQTAYSALAERGPERKKTTWVCSHAVALKRNAEVVNLEDHNVVMIERQ